MLISLLAPLALVLFQSAPAFPPAASFPRPASYPGARSAAPARDRALPPADTEAKQALEASPRLRPPVARKQPKTLRIHGDTLVDDYHWMRNKGTPEVEAYLKEEAAYADAFMKPTAAVQQKLYDEMLSRIQQTDTNAPYRERGHFYYSRTEEGKQYPIYARKKGALDAPEEVILDVNRLAEGKQFISVDAMRVSPDENRLAYTTDDTGFRQYTLRIKDLRTGQVGSEAIPRVTSVEWTEDGSTLFYSTEDAQTKRSNLVFRHTPGAAKDDLVYDEKDERFSVYVWKSRDRKMLFVEAGSLTSSEVRFFPADQPRAAMKVIAPRAAEHQYDVEHRDGTFWIRTNDKGRNFRLVTVRVAAPGRANWKEVLPHRDDVMLSGHSLFKDFYVLFEREGGFPRLRVTDFRSGQSHRVEVPEPASTISPDANREFDAPRYRFAYQSPVTSSSVYDYDPVTRERRLLKQVAVLGGYDRDRYTVETTQATAADGRKVPMWLLYRKDLERDGGNPALLYAYGSYGSSNDATFNSNLFSLVDRGVVYAVAYIRGGGELGKKWHDEGRMLSKKNTFTDFIAAAEHLIASRYTNRDRLAAMGGSAGGLLMGAVANLRPDLFKVVVSYVPFVDVINTMLDKTLPLTVGEFEEWGNPEIEEQYRYMLAYSPYDQLARKAYPTMLVKTSYNDSQVMYWEPAKYVAKLRAMKTDRNPLVFAVNMDPAGHGGKSGRYEKLRERAYDYAFILWQLGVETPASR
jgi:oligopeptidase B